ncbi:hypothetical protein M378DRAFT_548737 [Amanita muscaria Koide BX008]|uniref:Uncharacterized protein n=1 Tax=Amanita muscaria (strain Koide BX008) TaxID=946122 RepID=A0A0C2S064_AMAMK|nr:hypothetical protein M378DRAFT_548737 [Amanita muscaria Koide BX008]
MLTDSQFRGWLPSPIAVLAFAREYRNWLFARSDSLGPLDARPQYCRQRIRASIHSTSIITASQFAFVLSVSDLKGTEYGVSQLSPCDSNCIYRLVLNHGSPVLWQSTLPA